MNPKQGIYEYVAAAIVKAATEKTPKLVDRGQGPYHEAAKRLTRDESKQYALRAKYEQAKQVVRFCYGELHDDGTLNYGKWHELPSEYSDRVVAHLRKTGSKPIQTVTVRYAELDLFL